MFTKEQYKVWRRERTYKRKAEARALLGGVCVVCGTTKRLEFDHVDPSTKLFEIGRSADSVTDEAFWLEVAKCQLLCRLHHLEKSRLDGSLYNPVFGEANSKSKLTVSDVIRIRELHASGMSRNAIAREYGMSGPSIGDVVNRVTWKQVT